MKTRKGYISNSSSCSFVVYTGNIDPALTEIIVKKFKNNDIQGKLSIDTNYCNDPTDLECVSEFLQEAIYAYAKDKFLIINGEEIYHLSEEIKSELIKWGIPEDDICIY